MASIFACRLGQSWNPASTRCYALFMKYRVIILIVIVVAVLSFLAFRTQEAPAHSDEALLDSTSYTGKVICLPLKSGIRTDDCAPGLSLSSGTTYGLALEGLVDEEVAFSYSPLVTVTGRTVPVAQHVAAGYTGPMRDWTLYEISFVIEANSINESSGL